VAVTLTATATGYPDYELREVAREVAEHHGSVPLMEARYRPVAGAFALNQQKWSSIAALEDDFSWEGDGEFVGLVSSLNLDQGVGVRVEASSPSSQGEGETSAARTESGASLEHRGTDSSRFALRAPFWLPKEWDVALHRRKGALFLNQGYPLKLDQEFGFALPPNSFSTVLPEPMENKSAPLRWRLEWAKMADARLAARLNIELAQGELSSEDTFRFQKQVRDLLSALAQQVVVR
jgi:hypothetical protein